jgi:hypothetical protein
MSYNSSQEPASLAISDDDSFTDTISSGGASRYSLELNDEPPRPTRSEYATYQGLLHNLENREAKPLARRLRRLAETATGSSSRDSSPRSSSTSTRPAASILPRDLSTRWPLIVADLPSPLPSLDEAIVLFASAYIRRARLVLPQQLVSEEASVLPSDLATSTRLFINTSLVSLAGLRPVSNFRHTSEMKAMGWDTALSGLDLDAKE